MCYAVAFSPRHLFQAAQLLAFGSLLLIVCLYIGMHMCLCACVLMCMLCILYCCASDMTAVIQSAAPISVVQQHTLGPPVL